MLHVLTFRSPKLPGNIWPFPSHDVHLSHQYGTTHSHADYDDRQTHSHKLQLSNVDPPPLQHLLPPQPSKRRRERGRKCTIVGTDRQRVYRGPVSPFADQSPGSGGVDAGPLLQHAGEEHGGADVRSCALFPLSVLSSRVCQWRLTRQRRRCLGSIRELTLHSTTERNPMPPIAPIVPVFEAQVSQPRARTATQPAETRAWTRMNVGRAKGMRRNGR